MRIGIIPIRPLGPPSLFLALALAARGAAAQPATPTDAAPPGLHWEQVAYDAASGRLIVFGGATAAGALPAMTWAWDGDRWTVVADSAAGPGARHAHAMAFDAERRRVVLFGGLLESRDTTRPAAERVRRLCDTWALEDRAWRRLDDGASCPTDRVAAASLVWDTRARALLLVDAPATGPTDTVVRPLRLWRLLSGGWAPEDSSGPRRSRMSAGGVAWDARRGVLVVPVLDGPDAGVWEWDGRRWRHARATGPAPRRNFGLAYDARRGRVLLVGGLAASPRRPLDDRWTWDGASWTREPDDPAAPGARSHASLVTDAARGRLLYFGGAGPAGLLRELWILDRGGWRPWRAGAGY
jgi:hypothetical protein